MVLIEILKTEKHKKKNGNVFTIQKSFFSEIIFLMALQITDLYFWQRSTRYSVPECSPGWGRVQPELVEWVLDRHH